MKVKSHGIHFDKTGECKRCGACERPKCPHFSIVNGLATCDTYGTGDYLEWRCDVFPDTPFCRVVLDGICGFKFRPITADDRVKYREYLRIWHI